MVARCYPLRSRCHRAGIYSAIGDDVQSIIELITAVGFPAAVVLVLLLFLWRAGRWAAPLGRQVVSEQLEFLKVTKENQTRQTDLIELMSETENSHSRALLHLSEAAEAALDGEKDQARAAVQHMRKSIEQGDP